MVYRKKKSVTLYASVNWYTNYSLSTLEEGLDNNGSQGIFSVNKSSLSLGHSLSFSRVSIVRARVPPPLRVKRLVTPLEDLTTALMEDNKIDTLYLPDKWGHHKIAGSDTNEHSNCQCQKRLSLCLSTCEICTINNPASFLVQFRCCGQLACYFRY